MRIQINFNEKSIEILSNEKFQDIFDRLNKLFPNDEWKEYTLTQKASSVSTFFKDNIITKRYDINDAINCTSTNIKYVNSY